MRSRRYLAGALCVVLIAASALLVPQVAHVLGSVRTADDQPVSGAEVDIDGIVLGAATSNGAFSVDVPPFKVGFPYTFHVAGWVILDPCILARGRLYLPDPAAEKVVLSVVHRGDIQLLSTNSIGCLVEEKAARFEPKTAKEGTPRAGLQSVRPTFADVTTAQLSTVATPGTQKARMVRLGHLYTPLTGNAQGAEPSGFQESGADNFLSQQAEAFGFTVQQLQSAIARWREEASGPYQKGLADLDSGRYAEARDSIAQAIKGGAGPVERYVPLARAEYELGDSTAAQQDLRHVLAVHSEDPLLLNDLRIVAGGDVQQEASPRLPEGAVYATADVDPDSTIEVQQPGYAVIAAASVLTRKRVQPGDHLRPQTTLSMLFDTGKGVLIRTLREPAPPLTATAGSTPLLTQDQPQPLPLNGGNTTIYIGSNQAFTTPAIATGAVTRLPAETYVTILDHHGGKIGQLSDYSGLPAESGAAYRILTQDANGVALNEARITGGALDGSPMAAFDRNDYHPGQHGMLTLSNQENYVRMVEITRFGGSGGIRDEPIRILPLSDVRGLPPSVPFSTTKLAIQVMHVGEARAAVYFPRAVPPHPVANDGNNPVLKESNARFQQWLAQIPEE